eukprot:CAMPEP_0172452212 /NCGR_PEP_ID=MMETSP1065-20121228/9944_1 /TAXON_ID=265537 /ORGANISM="Amphiprora paludosa, Strain CCMP125" /LENGTH=580 /DNA_ID=CAMNT_0013204243 /DNA_START=326 /DNA_END=2068 /DNA_ORIENTATION=+
MPKMMVSQTPTLLQAPSEDPIQDAHHTEPTTGEYSDHSEDSTVVANGKGKQHRPRDSLMTSRSSSSVGTGGSVESLRTSFVESHHRQTQRIQKRRAHRDSLDKTPSSMDVIALPAAKTLALKRLRGILKKSPQKPAQQQQKPKVSFANVYLREYARTVGDNPSCSSGPPISIDWEHTPTSSQTLDHFEQKRRNTRRSNVQLVVSRQARETMLRREWGIKQSELASAVRACIKIKNSRKTTVQNLVKPTEKAEERLESMSKKLFGSRQKKQAQKLTAQQQKVQEAKEKQQQLLLEQQEQEKVRAQQQQHSLRQAQAAQTISGQGQRPKRRLSSPSAAHALEELNADPDANAQPITYPLLHQPVAVQDLIARMVPTNEGKALPSIVRRGNPNKDPKSVSFALNARQGQVWCLVREVEKFNVEYHTDLWWPEQDLDDRYEQDMETASLLGAQYGNLLKRAYKSTRPVPGQPAVDHPDTVEFELEQVSECSIARGLEAEVMSGVLGRIAKTHQQAVLTKQEVLWEGYSDRHLGATILMDDDDQESLRQDSLKFSRASRIMARKMAEFDAYDAPYTMKAQHLKKT